MSELAGRKTKAWFLLNAMRYWKLLPRYAAAPASSSLGRYIRERPELCGALVWPYQCSAWCPRERFARIESHFAALDHAPDSMRFASCDRVLLADLSDYSPGTRLVLDQPKWMFREGLLTLNIFVDEERAYSLSFSLNGQGTDTEVFVGGLQGRRSAEALAQYKAMTHDFHGLRPRDLLVEGLKTCSQVFGATRICAVADEHRYFRHPYFGRSPQLPILGNFDEIWTELGGRRVAPTHFELPRAPAIRQPQDVASKKRARYQRRNALLESLVHRVQEAAARRPAHSPPAGTQFPLVNPSYALLRPGVREA